MIGFGFSVVTLAVNQMLGFNPRSLFANGEQGWVYDPSNLSTLFQDAAGTTPVTAMEQPVGLQLDTRLGLVPGPELVTNGEFETNINGWTAISAATLSWDAGRLKSVVSAASGPSQQLLLTVGRWYKISAVVQSPSGVAVSLGVLNNAESTFLAETSRIARDTPTSVTLYFFSTETNSKVYMRCGGAGTFYLDSVTAKELPGNHRYQTTSANRPVVSARVNLFVGTETLATQTVTTRATTQTLTFTGSGSITLSGTATGTYTAGTYSITTTAGSLVATVSGTVTQADIRASNMGVGLPAYQRVNTSTDYDTAGFPVYIKPNGSNQFMVTNSINFSATDKMTVWQGVRKLSDGTTGNYGAIMELSAVVASNNGAFNLFGPSDSPGGTPSFGVSSKGTTAASATVPTGYSAPITYVLTVAANISAPSLALRANGSQVASSSATQGTGNYGNYPAYFYARAGSQYFFNGHDYGSICRGAASTAGEITSAETWINNRTKAF